MKPALNSPPSLPPFPLLAQEAALYLAPVTRRRAGESFLHMGFSGGKTGLATAGRMWPSELTADENHPNEAAAIGVFQMDF